MRSIILVFATILMTLQLVTAAPGVLPMAYGGLVSRQLRTDQFNRIRLAPGYQSPARRSGRISSPDAPSANGASTNVTGGNSTVIFNNGEGNGQSGGTSTSEDATGRSGTAKLH